MDLLEYYNAIAYASAFSVIIPISFSLYRLATQSKMNKILLSYLFLSLTVEIINMIFLSCNKSNIIVIEVFKLIELFLIINLFRSFNVLSRTTQVIASALTGAGVLLFMIDLGTDTTILFNGFTHCCILALSFMVFYKILLDEYNIAELDFFWITSGILFYFSVSFFLFLLNDFTGSLTENLAKNLWLINLTSNVLYYMFLTVGIWKIKRR